MTTPSVRTTTLFSVLFGLALLAITGCSHQKEYVPETDPKAPPRPTMQGYGDFFDGKILVEASLGRGFRMRPGKMKEYESKNRGGSESSPFADVYYLDDKEDAEDQYFIPRMNNSTLPPVALRVRVTNNAGQPVDVEFIECNSALGNFAVRPEKITIASGDTGAPDPMTSLLGITGDEIPIKVGLKIGNAKETKTITLHIIKTAQPPVDGSRKTKQPAPAAPAS